MAKSVILRGKVFIKEATLASGSGDDLLTIDATTGEVGKISGTPLTTTLTAGNLFVGNASNVATAVAMSGDVTIDSSGVTAIGTGVIVNADINASAAIAVSKLAALTASRAVVSDASGFLSVSATTDTQIGYLSTTTSDVQTQINAKQATITGAATTIVSSDLTANRALVSGTLGKVEVSAVTNTELGYVSGVTSAIQTQFAGKLSATVTGAATGDIIYYNGTNWVNLPKGTDGQTLRSSAATILWDTPTINGIPIGGTAGQVLAKNSGTDFDASWATLTVTSITDLTATAAELNVLDGAVISTAELNFLDNASANIQDQLNNKMSNSLTTDYIFKGVAGVATASTDLPSGITIGGAAIYRSGGSDVALADGGTGASLIDPNGDRIMFWDDSAGAVTWLTAGTGLTITDTTISASVGATNSAAANEIMKSDGTNAVTSQIWSLSLGNLQLGSTGFSGSTRTILAQGSATDVGLTLTSKGNANTSLTNGTYGEAEVTLVGGPTSADSHGYIAGNGLHEIERKSGAASAVTTVLTLKSTSSTPANGTGTGLQFQTLTAAANYEVGSSIESVSTDVTAGSEDFALTFKTMSAGASAAERLRITSTGNILIGNPNPSSFIDGRLFVEGQPSSSSILTVSTCSNTSSNSTSQIKLVRSRGVTAGSTTIVASDDYLGAISFYGADGANHVYAGMIAAHVDGNPGVNDMPTRLSFWTTPDGASSPTEKLRITSDGRLYGTALHNNAGSVTGTTNQYIASGTYTPTLTNVANAGGTLSSDGAQYIRVGNVVTVSGKLQTIPTAATTLTQIGISLPVASNFASAHECSGTAASRRGSFFVGTIHADATSDRAELWFDSVDNVNAHVIYYTFTYTIL